MLAQLASLAGNPTQKRFETATAYTGGRWQQAKKQDMIKIQLIFVLFLFEISCKGQNLQESQSLDSFKFESIFGYNKNDSSSIYCLLGQGFFKAPFSNDADSVISNWLLNHKNAKVIPVSSVGSTMTDDPNSKMTYCWIIDKKDTLNISLIRNGCFPGGTMQRPKTWKEMEKWERQLYEAMDKPKIVVYITEIDYKTFVDRIIIAESYAKQNKLGIWKDK